MGKSKNVTYEIEQLEQRLDKLEAEIAELRRQVDMLTNKYKPGPSETKIPDNLSWTGGVNG